MPPSDQPPSPTTGGSPPPPATVEGGAATSTPAVVEATPIQGPQPTPDPAVPVQAAREALAARLGVGVDAVRVVAVERVDWPDGCLGAADPGEACILMITPGYRVTLAVQGVEYVYHTDGGTRVRPERGRPVAPSAAQ